MKEAAYKGLVHRPSSPGSMESQSGIPDYQLRDCVNSDSINKLKSSLNDAWKDDPRSSTYLLDNIRFGNVKQTNCWYSDGYTLCSSCSRFVSILLRKRFHYKFSFLR